MTGLVQRLDEGGIASLTLASPGNINALSRAMLTELRAVLAGVAADEGVRVVILRAEGRNFCAGHDLKEIQSARTAPDGGKAAIASLFDLCAQVMQQITTLPQPVIAQVQGVATAAGCQLACSCDLIVASETARLGVNGINIGLFCSSPMVALTRRLAPAAAFELLTTGEFLPAPRAHALGAVNRICPPEALETETLALAHSIAAKDPAAIRLGKAAFRAQMDLPLDQAYAIAAGAMTDNAMLPATAEAIQGFIDRRPAKS